MSARPNACGILFQDYKLVDSNKWMDYRVITLLASVISHLTTITNLQAHLTSRHLLTPFGWERLVIRNLLWTFANFLLFFPTIQKPPEHYIPPGEAPPPYEDSIGVTILPCYEVTTNTTNVSTINNNNGSANLTSVATSPLQLPQVSQGTQNTLHMPTNFAPAIITIQNPLATSLSPIVETINSDERYEHITVVRVNGDNTNSSVNENNASDSNSSSSALSTPTTASSPSSDISSSTSTESTIRPAKNNESCRL